MAGTKRSAESSAPVAGNKRRASSGQGVTSAYFDGGKQQGSSGSKGKGRKSAARQMTPEDSDDEAGDRPRTPDLSTPSKPKTAAADPTTAYPTPSKTPAKKALLKQAAKDVGVVRLDEEDEPEVQVVEQKPAAAGSKAKAKVAIVEKSSGQVKQPEKLKVKDKRWNQAYADAREKMGGKDPIHGEDQNKIDQILRVFDMTDDYGPCVGMTRLERWQRAEDLGLDPPQDVRTILLTQEGLDDARYRENVFAAYLDKATAV